MLSLKTTLTSEAKKLKTGMGKFREYKLARAAISNLKGCEIQVWGQISNQEEKSTPS